MLPARENPFSADRIEQLLEFDPGWLGLDWVRILERAGELGHRGAIVGPHGSGKTAFLDAFAPRLVNQGFRVIRWFLNDESPRPEETDWKNLPRINEDIRTILFIDGAEFLSRASRRRILETTEKTAGLIVTAHAEGMLPTLLQTRTSPEMLATFARRLAPRIPAPDAELQNLFHRHSGNLREALWSCYDLMAAEDSR